MRKQTRHRFVATNYNHYKCLLPFLLYNSYCTKFAQQRKGKLAKTKIFLSLTSGVCFFALECNSATAFLIEYHCLDDRKALADLKASNIRNKERVWLLYTILKDADALDRVRFGMRAVDPKYFRNEMAHKLLPTAQSCVGQLKL